MNGNDDDVRMGVCRRDHCWLFFLLFALVIEGNAIKFLPLRDKMVDTWMSAKGGDYANLI